MYIDDCLEAVLRFMRQDKFLGPVNIGSEEMVTINQLAQIAIDISKKDLKFSILTEKILLKNMDLSARLVLKGKL